MKVVVLEESYTEVDVLIKLGFWMWRHTSCIIYCHSSSCLCVL